MSQESRSEAAEKPKVKVHDKRMFTPDGQLREEYSFLEETTREPPPEPDPRPEPEREPPERDDPEPRRDPDRPSEPERREPDPDPTEPERPPIELPPTQGPGGGPGFYDLVAVLAEPASIYLQEVQAAAGQEGADAAESRLQHLELARLHIDLLDVLKVKTAGRLTVQESNVLEDALYQLRMAYVHLRG